MNHGRVEFRANPPQHSCGLTDISGEVCHGDRKFVWTQLQRDVVECKQALVVANRAGARLDQVFAGDAPGDTGKLGVCSIITVGAEGSISARTKTICDVVSRPSDTSNVTAYSPACPGPASH